MLGFIAALVNNQVLLCYFITFFIEEDLWNVVILLPIIVRSVNIQFVDIQY